MLIVDKEMENSKNILYQ